MRHLINIIAESEKPEPSKLQQFDEWIRKATNGKVCIKVLDQNQHSFCLARTDGEGTTDTMVDKDGAEDTFGSRFHYNWYDIIDPKVGREKLRNMLNDALTLAKADKAAPEPEPKPIKLFVVCVTDGTDSYAPKIPATDEEHAKKRALGWVEKTKGTSAWRIHSCMELSPSNG
jgi:hypothetical protein